MGERKEGLGGRKKKRERTLAEGKGKKRKYPCDPWGKGESRKRKSFRTGRGGFAFASAKGGGARSIGGDL